MGLGLGWGCRVGMEMGPHCAYALNLSFILRLIYPHLSVSWHTTGLVRKPLLSALAEHTMRDVDVRVIFPSAKVVNVCR